MSVPEAFGAAYAGLERLVGRLRLGGLRGPAVEREARRWLRDDARGSLTLCEAAILAMRHEAGAEGVAGGDGGDREGAKAALRALDDVGRAIDPPEDGEKPARKPVEVRVPEELKKRAPRVRGFRLGRVEILAEPGPPCWRLSISHPERFPTWGEILLSRGVTGDVTKSFAAVVPAASSPPDPRGRTIDLIEADFRASEGGR